MSQQVCSQEAQIDVNGRCVYRNVKIWLPDLDILHQTRRSTIGLQKILGSSSFQSFQQQILGICSEEERQQQEDTQTAKIHEVQAIWSQQRSSYGISWEISADWMPAYRVDDKDRVYFCLLQSQLLNIELALISLLLFSIGYIGRGNGKTTDRSGWLPRVIRSFNPIKSCEIVWLASTCKQIKERLKDPY